MAKVQAKNYQRTLGQDCEFHPLELWRGITDKELRNSGSLHLIVDRSDYKGIPEEIRLSKNQRPSLGGIDYSEISLRLEKYYNHWRLEGILDYSVGREGMSTPIGNQIQVHLQFSIDWTPGSAWARGLKKAYSQTRKIGRLEKYIGKLTCKLRRDVGHEDIS